MLSLFRKKPVLDEPSIQWLLDTFLWSMTHFGHETFYQRTSLVRPNNEFFPGRETSVSGMADMIFDHVLGHAQLASWRCSAVEAHYYQPPAEEQIKLLGYQRDSEMLDIQQATIHVPYDPQLVGNPEGLIASYAHSLAYYLCLQVEDVPPGGRDNLPMVAEVVATYMGFGLMTANTAFHHRGGCGSCSAAMAARSASLSQYDTTYALAIFAALKGLPNRAVLPDLKSSLRPYFKKARKDVEQQPTFHLLQQAQIKQLQKA